MKEKIKTIKAIKEEFYREAARIWKSKNPDQKNIPYNEVITISNGKKINLGMLMSNMRHNIHKLTEDQKEFWKDYGLFEERKFGKRKNNNQISNNQISNNQINKNPQNIIVSISTLISKKYNISLATLLFLYESVEEYKLLDVGLEEDIECKKEKIKKYQFAEEDIEESYFVAFSFKTQVLEKKKEELLKRDGLLRQYIIDWNYYNEEEKQEEIKRQIIVEEEIEFINKSREEIDRLVKLLKNDSKKDFI